MVEPRFWLAGPAEFSGWELNGRGVNVVGGFTMERSFGADASVLTSDENFARSLQLPGVGQVNFGLLSVPPEQVDDVVRQLNLRLALDVRAWSRADLVALAEDYWVRQTATGKIFAYGVLVTILVAAVVIYQVLANDIRDHIVEYATLKASMAEAEPLLARARWCLFALRSDRPATSASRTCWS